MRVYLSIAHDIYMISTVRYLVSQYFGKIVARVESAPLKSTVALEVELPVPRTLQFVFVQGRLSPLARMDDGVHDLAIRIAIAQARKMRLHLAPCARNGPHRLDENTRPWLGDLMSEPYGGATAGVERLALSKAADITMQADRRINMALCTAVERGVAAQKRQGADAAILLMADHGVPDHVMLRVVSCAAFRRKTR